MEIRKGSECLVGLECLLNIVRALGMGSCFSGDGSASMSCAPASPSSSKKRNSFGRRNRRPSSSSSTSSPSSSYATVDSKMEIWLHRVPGRFCLNGSTDVASLFTKQGRKGVNQDAMIVWEVLLLTFAFSSSKISFFFLIYNISLFCSGFNLLCHFIIIIFLFLCI